MNRLIMALLTLALLAPATAAAHNHDAHDHAHDAAAASRGARLIVADAQANVVHVLDIDSSEVIGTFTVPGETGGTVTVTASGRYALVAHRDANRVSVIHSGLTVEDHGDHAHLLQGSPYVLATMNVGRQPTHIAPAGSRLLVFNDADGSIAILDENLFGLSLNYDLIEAAGPDHGAALLVGDFVLAGYLASGSVDVFDSDSNLLDTHDGCDRLHGALLVGNTAVFGCADGVLLAELDGDQFHWTSIANPAGGPEEARVGSFYGQHGSVAIGNYGSGLALIDVETADFRTIELPAAPLAAAVSGAHAVVLDVDGHVQLVDLDAGQVEAELQGVVPAGTGSGRPGVALLADRAFVTDPAGGQVVILDISQGAASVTGVITVPGSPSGVGVLLPEGDFLWH